MTEFKIGSRLVGTGHPIYFIAELGSNHDGSLERAKHLIDLAADAGASAVKFQHYRAKTLTSKAGFDNLITRAHYTDNPYNVFQRYATPYEWIPALKEHCDQAGVEFMSTPYDLEAVYALEPYVNAYKIGSGDINNLDFISLIAKRGKPVILSTGASTTEEVRRAVGRLRNFKIPFCLLQCNTNYSDTATDDRYLNVSVVRTFAEAFGCVVGLSDHTTSVSAVVAAVALGASVIERHFTDGTSNSPDDPFATLPEDFASMVEIVNGVQAVLGNGVKVVEPNELETRVLQRRSVHAVVDIPKDTIISLAMIACLRPAPPSSIEPSDFYSVVGKRAARNILAGEGLKWGIRWETVE